MEDLCYHIKEDNIGIAFTNSKLCKKNISNLDILFLVFSSLLKSIISDTFNKVFCFYYVANFHFIL